MQVFFKIVRHDFYSVGLLRARRIRYKLGKWVKPKEPLSGHPRKGGGLWVLKKLGDARHLKKYLLKKHGISARIFTCKIGKVLYETSYRIKTDRVCLLKEVE